MAPPIKSAANPFDSHTGGTDPLRPNPPSNNLWIGNVSQDVSEAELKALFEKHGVVHSIITYPARNYGFVNFKDVEAAKSARLGLQGQNLRGNPLKIEFAKPAKPCKSLWVAGISPSTSKDELEKEFQRFGKIQEFRFLRNRNTVYVDYVRLEDAAQALKSMDRKQVGGVQIRVDYFRSQSSRREQGVDGRDGGQFPSRYMGPSDFHWIEHSSFNNYPGPGLSGWKRKNLLSVGSDAVPSKILFISYPPSVFVDEHMLHNAMILFGEIERIRAFSDRNYAFVEFRSADEAKCAKEGLQGKLFNDPRISIEYSSIEFPGSREQTAHPLPPLLGVNHSVHLHNNPGLAASLGVRGPELYARPPLGAHAMLEPPLQGLEFMDLAAIHKLQNPNPQILMGGSAWGKSSPTSGIVSSPSSGFSLPKSNRSSYGAWDLFDANQHQSEPKRSRLEASSPPENMGGLDEKYGFHYLGSGGALGSTRGSASRHGQHHVDSDCIWRGLIAKVGTPVCHARCVPIGDGLDIDIPDVVNCTARTGLDVLSERYDDAVGFSVVFFLPDSEEDFDSYTEFLRHLGSKDRAGVAKFDDGTTLFLVPPSDFLSNVLKVSGPERLYGVVLKFLPVIPNNSSAMNPQSKHPQCMDPHKLNPLPIRNGVNFTGDKFSSLDNSMFLPNDPKLHPKALVPATSSLPVHSVPPPTMSQPGLTLTPELIATLTSLLPASSSGLHTGTLQPLSSGMGAEANGTSGPDNGARWKHEHQVVDHSGNLAEKSSQINSQMQHFQAAPTVSNTAGHLHQTLNSYGPLHDFHTISPQGAPSTESIAPAIPKQSRALPVSADSSHHYRQDGFQNILIGEGVDHGAEPLNFYHSSTVPQPAYPMASSNQPSINGVPLHQPYMPVPFESTHQSQPLQTAPIEVAQENVETESDKNERYKTTLLFAANLLSRIHQPTGNQPEPGTGSH